MKETDDPQRLDPLAEGGEAEETDDFAGLWLPTRALCRVSEYLLALLLFAVFALNFINVIGRRAIDITPASLEPIARFFSSLGWIDEASRFIIIWVGFIGAAIVFAARKHVALTMVLDRVGARTRFVLRILHTLAVGGLFAVYLWFGIMVTRYAINRSTALDVPMSLVYLCVPVAALLGLYFAVEQLFKLLRARS